MIFFAVLYTWCIILQIGEMDVEMVKRWLIMKESSNPGCR